MAITVVAFSSVVPESQLLSERVLLRCNELHALLRPRVMKKMTVEGVGKSVFFWTSPGHVSQTEEFFYLLQRIVCSYLKIMAQ